ncbi:hypothetical protein HY622_03565 [Candidatus Uhrbacteria bacterium]|nr:hypothetical protein [Candidatus Uhrbacteria bacterium]
MSLRLRIVLISLVTVVVAVLIGIGIWLYGYFTRKPSSVPPITTSGSETVDGQIPSVGQEEPTGPIVVTTPVEQREPVSEQDRARAAIVSIIMPFVERLGSYSNQSSFENYTDLLGFMTPSMQEWAQREVAAARSKPLPEIYKGMTTRALAQDMTKLDLDAGEAEFTVSTQRKEIVGTSTNFKTYNQDILIKLKKQENVWLVDGAYWQK